MLYSTPGRFQNSTTWTQSRSHGCGLGSRATRNGTPGIAVKASTGHLSFVLERIMESVHLMHNSCDFHEIILRYCRLKIFEIPLRCVLFHFNCFSYSMTKIKTNIVVESGFESARTSQSVSSILESLRFTHTFVKIRISGYLVGLHA